jgi:hypothetical protein
MSDRPQKISFTERRDMGVRGILVYCADYRCSRSIAISGGVVDDIGLVVAGGAWVDDIGLVAAGDAWLTTSILSPPAVLGDDIRLSDIEARFVCRGGHRGADVRPDYNWNRRPVGGMGYR